MLRWLSALLVVAVALFLAPAPGQARADEKKKSDPDKKEAPSDEHGYLGVNVDPNATDGAGVESVPDDTPAAKAGIKQGDKIVKVNGKDVKSYTDLAAIMKDTKVGDMVDVTVKRDDKEMKFKVTLGKRPAESPPPP